MDQTLAPSKQHGIGLLLWRFHLDKTHFWTLCRDNDRFGIGRVVLLPLDEKPDILRWDQLHFMAKP